ncbi:hypothetical protein BVX98_02585 [bacterium F11]|nr:hypothetical protein BVX98_02585 [bacterium F11]
MKLKPFDIILKEKGKSYPFVLKENNAVEVSLIPTSILSWATLAVYIFFVVTKVKSGIWKIVLIIIGLILGPLIHIAAVAFLIAREKAGMDRY